MSSPPNRSYVDAVRSGLPTNSTVHHATKPRATASTSANQVVLPATPPRKRPAAARSRDKPSTPVTPQRSQGPPATGLPTPETTPLAPAQQKARASGTIGGTTSSTAFGPTPAPRPGPKKAPGEKGPTEWTSASQVASSTPHSSFAATQARRPPPKKSAAQKVPGCPSIVSNAPSSGAVLTFGDFLNVNEQSLNSSQPAVEQATSVSSEARRPPPNKSAAQKVPGSASNASNAPSSGAGLTFGDFLHVNDLRFNSSQPAVEQVIAVLSDSEMDGGAQIDPKDPPYWSSTQRNRVGPSASIIKTRRARAAEAKLAAEPRGEQAPEGAATGKGKKRPVEDRHDDEEVAATQNVYPSSSSSDVQGNPVTATSPRKRVQRSNPVVDTDDDANLAIAPPTSTVPVTAQNVQEIEPHISHENTTPALDHASETYDYEGADMDEYEASFIDDTADDIAEMGDVGEERTASPHRHDFTDSDGSQADNVGDDVVNDYDSDMYTDAEGDEQEATGDADDREGDSAQDHDSDVTPPGAGESGSINSEDQAEVAVSEQEETPADVGDELTFGAVVGHRENANNAFTRYQDDPEYTFFKGRLTEDGTLVPKLQDALLKKFYTSSLEKYQRGVLITWSSTETTDGMVEFSTWNRRVPKMIFKSCINAINFQRCGPYVNLARVALQDLAVRNVNAAGQTYQLYTSDKRVAICLSAVEIRDSFLYTPPKRGLRKKGVTGSMHTQEYERDVGCVCTVFDVPELHAQIFQNAISFETRSEYAKDEDVKTSKVGASKSSAARSPAVAVSNTPRSSAAARLNDGFALNYNSEIPVYDARTRVVDFNTDLDRLESFPRWKGEVPYGSFAVVAYTTNKFWSATNKGWAVGFNIQWVMVIGVKAQYDV